MKPAQSCASKTADRAFSNSANPARYDDCAGQAAPFVSHVRADHVVSSYSDEVSLLLRHSAAARAHARAAGAMQLP